MMQSRAFSVAVIPGDGIGTEVVPPAVELIAAAAAGDADLTFTTFPWSCAYYEETGAMMPPEGVDELRRFDAIFLGAVGDPRRVPDHVSLWGLLLRIRRELDLSVNVRPAVLLRGVESPLRDPGAFDILFIRENSEGEYSRVGGSIHSGSDEIVMQTSVFTRRRTEAVIRYAFDQAMRRTRRLVSATKSNGIADTMPFWDRVVREVAVDYPEVQVTSTHVDALAARVIREPSSLDVVVGSNLFGDILTDIGGAIMGSLGLPPSANLDPSRRHPPMFEPVHGSAPDIAGQGIANPVAQVWCGSMLLSHLGLDAAAQRLDRAMRETVAAGETTPDLGGRLTTAQVAAAIHRRL